MAGKIEKRFIELNIAEDGEGFTGTLLNFNDIADKGSYKETAKASGVAVESGIIMNRQHNRALPVARAGTEHLQIERSADSINVKLNSWPNTPVANEAKALLDAGLIEGLSMEMNVDEASWDDNLRTIKSGTIVGLAMVDRGAYPSSVINRAWDGYEDEAKPMDPRLWL